MELLLEVVQGVLHSTLSEVIRVGVEGFCTTLCDSLEKMWAEEAIISAGKKACERAREALLRLGEVALEQAPREVQDEGSDLVVLEEGEEEQVSQAEAEEVLISQAEGEVFGSEIPSGASQFEMLTIERQSEGESSVSEVRVAGEKALSVVQEEPSVSTSLAEDTSARESCDLLLPVQEDAVENSSPSITFSPAAIESMQPPCPEGHHQFEGIELPSIQEDGIFSGDAFSLPESLGDTFSGPFDRDTLPFLRGDASPEISSPLVPLPCIESPTELAHSPQAADLLESTEAVSPLEQSSTAPETESMSLSAESLTEPADSPLVTDAPQATQAAPVIEQTRALPERERECLSSEECTDDERAAQAWNTILEAALSAACEEDAQRQEYERILESLPAEYAALAEHVPYFQSSDLHCIGVLGRGGQGSVAKVEAIDAFSKQSKLALKVDWKGKKGDELLREAWYLIKFANPYTVRLQGITLVGHRLGLLFELADAKRLWKSGVQSSPKKLAAASEQLIQVATGVEFLHSQGVVHCDLKGDNALPVNGLAKVSDLGYACRKELLDPQEGVGTDGYTAPEVGDQGNSTAGDIWSLGALAFKAATGKSLLHHFKGDEQAMFAHLYNGGSLPWPESLRASACGRDFIRLVEMCLEWAPAKRPDARIVKLWLWRIYSDCKLELGEAV